MVKRAVLSVRINSVVKKEFLKLIEENGLSSCFIIESLLRGWIEGFKTAKNQGVYNCMTLTPITIYQKFERVVKRDRRSYREFRPEPNYYDAEATMWFYKKVDDFELNANGHVIGCGCSVCQRGNQPKKHVSVL